MDISQHIRPKLGRIGLGIVLREIGGGIDDTADLRIDRLHLLFGGELPFQHACSDALDRIALLADAPDEALVETECPDRTSRISMKREGANSLLLQAEASGSRGTSTLKARYTYEGACTAQGTTMRFDKDSEACRQLRAQIEQMDPDKSCARAAQRAECEARLRAAAEQMAAMCR